MTVKSKCTSSTYQEVGRRQLNSVRRKLGGGVVGRIVHCPVRFSSLDRSATGKFFFFLFFSTSPAGSSSEALTRQYAVKILRSIGHDRREEPLATRRQVRQEQLS